MSVSLKYLCLLCSNLTKLISISIPFLSSYELFISDSCTRNAFSNEINGGDEWLCVKWERKKERENLARPVRSKFICFSWSGNWCCPYNERKIIYGEQYIRYNYNTLLSINWIEFIFLFGSHFIEREREQERKIAIHQSWYSTFVRKLGTVSNYFVSKHFVGMENKEKAPCFPRNITLRI